MFDEFIKSFDSPQCRQIHWFYLIIICLLLVVLLIYKRMNTPPSLKGAYLNYSSTNSKLNGSLNPSDLAYPQVLEERKDLAALEVKIMKLVNAPITAKVIINSGATESIAQCIFWAKCYNQYGIVQGSNFDHSAVKDNCDNLELVYDSEALMKNKILDNCSMIFLTQVNSRNGEIFNVKKFKQNVLDKYGYLQDGSSGPYNKHVRQYRPLVVLDATQSLNKVPIDMERWGLNAIFCSLHKLGAPIGLGVLIINDTMNNFKPLIAGNQQSKLRGGTYALDSLLNHAYIFDQFDDLNDRKESWQHAFDKLTAAGLKVYKPTTDHLYNTLLIEVNKCPLATINDLALKNIYVGNVSACANEIEEKRQKAILSGGEKEKKTFAPFERAIRISFKKGKELDDSILDAIIDEVHKP